MRCATASSSHRACAISSRRSRFRSTPRSRARFPSSPAAGATPSPSGAAGPPKAAGPGGGRTASTDAGYTTCAPTQKENHAAKQGQTTFVFCPSAGLRADEDLAFRLDCYFAFLIARHALKNADAAAVLRLVELLGDRPFGRERIAGTHRRLEAAMVLEVGERSAREVHADRCRDQRRSERPMQDARPEHRLLREL